MKRHRLLGAFILFVTATAAVAPIAYLLGLAHGARATPLAPEPDPAAFVDMTDAIWDCDQFGDFDGLRTIDIAIGCGIGMGKLSGPGRYLQKYGTPLAGGPLQKAMFTTIAGKAFVPPAPFQQAMAAETGAPLSLAMAPGGAGGGWGPSHAGDPGSLPLALPSGPMEGSPPPPVPLPGALSIMLTGLAGLAFAIGARRRRRA
jgi:hypothetical protein